jgi:signal peptidase
VTAAAPTVAAASARRTRGAQHAARMLSSVLLLVATMALVAMIVAGASGVRVRVEQTGSMAPTLRPGDLVLIRSVPVRDIRIADIIGVRDATGRVIVHRVERLDGEPGFLRVHTRGDANATGEDWRIPRGASVALVQGRIPSVGVVVNAIKGPVIAVIVAFAGLALAASALRSIWKRT